MLKKILIGLFIFFTILAGVSIYYQQQTQQYSSSPHFDGSEFRNLSPTSQKNLLDIIKWKITSRPAPWPEWVDAEEVHEFHPIGPGQRMVATFINHATFLIQLPGLAVMTDPIYSFRPSPVNFLGPKRVRDPGLRMEALPKVDVVVISHNHYDHLDLPTLRELDRRFAPLFLVPLGNARLLRREGLKNVKELDWWESTTIGDYRIHLTPAQHWSTRIILDRNKSLWGSYLIEDQQGPRVYFAGDTGYGPHFKLIRERLGSPELALLPIGAYEPRWFMQDHHINPAEAVKAHQELGAKLSLGMHFGTFQLTDEAIEAPVEDLAQALEQHKISSEEFMVLDFGQSHSF
jgi:L-ascorbate metabolism protein UlaG (beta-lactamase superfamily)